MTTAHNRVRAWESGQRIGRYRVEALLGEGGMAKVYKATHVDLDRPVALKALRTTSATLDERKRFLREARLTAQLVHPNVVTLLDFGPIDDTNDFFLAFEFLQGETLWDRFARGGPMPPEEVAKYGMAIARGLRAAHAAGILHRDLKPDNVMLVSSPEGEVAKLIDFGLGNFYREGPDVKADEGLLIGTPEYMAPEAARGVAVDQRVDLYALGIVLFELLTGVPPFQDENSQGTLRKQVHANVPKLADVRPRCTASREFEALIRSLLAKRADERPTTANDVLATFATLPEAAQGGERPSVVQSSVYSSRVTYAPEQRIAKTADSTTWSAVNVALGTKVVMKWLTSRTAEDQATRLSRCRALSLPRVLDVGKRPPPGGGDEAPYVVLDRLDLLPLDHLLQKDGPLEVDQALPLGRVLAEGLVELHEQELFHGRIRETNVLVDPLEPTHGVLIGFDLGRSLPADTELTSERRRELQRGDVRALASVLLNSLLGHGQQGATSTFRAAAQQIRRESNAALAVNPRLPDALSRTLARALAIGHPDAIQTAPELLEELSRIEANMAGARVLEQVEEGGAVQSAAFWKLSDRVRDVWVLDDDRAFAHPSVRMAFDGLPADLVIRRVTIDQRGDLADRLTRDAEAVPWAIVFGLRSVLHGDLVLEALRLSGETARIVLLSDPRDIEWLLGPKGMGVDRVAKVDDGDEDLVEAIRSALAEVAPRRARYDLVRSRSAPPASVGKRTT